MQKKSRAQNKFTRTQKNTHGHKKQKNLYFLQVKFLR